MSKDIQDILAASYGSYPYMGNTFFPNRFHRPFDLPHRKIFDLLRNSDSQLKLILAPRGTGKTSIDNLLVPAKKILFHDANYIVPVGASSTSAEEQSENLKDELMTNHMVNELFEVKKAGQFSKTRWELEVSGHEVCVQPRGAGQKIRGMIWKDSRPDLIIVDDIEDDEMVKSEERRKDLKKWFHGALMNTVDRGSDDWEIIVVGTLLHEDSLLANLRDDPAWDTIVLEICDDNMETNFPSFMSTKEVKELAQQYRESGEIDVFYREYRNKPISTEDRTFSKEFFKYYEERKGAGIITKEREDGQEVEERIEFYANPDIDTLIVVDPAKTAKMNSADSAIVGGSIDMVNNRMFVRDVVTGKFHPNELYEHLIAMVHRLGPTVVGVEVTGLNEFITYPIRNELFRAARNVELIELQARGGRGEDGKTARVGSLVPFYRQGLVFHNPQVCGGLESQLLSFPRSKKWDIMDAFAYFVEMLEKGQRYMEPEEHYDVSKKEIEKEYRDLEEFTMPNNSDFRIV